MTKKDVGDEVLVRDVTYNVAKKMVAEAVAEGVYKGGQRLLVLVILISTALFLVRVLLETMAG